MYLWLSTSEIFTAICSTTQLSVAVPQTLGLEKAPSNSSYQPILKFKPRVIMSSLGLYTDSTRKSLIEISGGNYSSHLLFPNGFELLLHTVTISGVVCSVCFKDGRNYEVYWEL